MKNQLEASAATDSPTHLKRMRKVLRGFALASTIAISGLAVHMAQASATEDSAGTPSFFHHMHGGATHEQMRAHFDKVLTNAGATDVQKQQIEGVIGNAMTAEHADMQKYHASFHELKDLLAADYIDEAAVAGVRTEQEQLAAAISDRATDTVITVAKMLTPEQRAKLSADLDKMLAAHTAPAQAK